MKSHLQQLKLNQRSGVSTLLFLIFFAVVCALIVAVIETRLLLAIQRTKSLGDALTANYDSESLINDFIYKLMTEPFPPLPQHITLADGTVIDVEGHEVAGPPKIQTITITTNRPYAVIKLEMVREISGGSIPKVDVILGLDCTGSMDARADCIYNGVPGFCDVTDPSQDSRFDAQKTAALNFIDTLISATSGPYYDVKEQLYLGILAFGVNAEWLRTTAGVPITPDMKFSSGTNANDIRDAVDQSFGKFWRTSPACYNNLMNTTSVGSAYIKAHNYLNTDLTPNVKKIEIIITDGEANSREPNPACGPAPFLGSNTWFCPYANGYQIAPESMFPPAHPTGDYCTASPEGWINSGGWQCHTGSAPNCNNSSNCANNCPPYGMDYLRCALATTTTPYDSVVDPSYHQNGTRDVNIDAYGVTVIPVPPAETVFSYETYLGADKYFNVDRASDLPTILQNILSEIVGSVTSVTIRRLTP